MLLLAGCVEVVAGPATVVVVVVGVVGVVVGAGTEAPDERVAGT